jgi:hypothetical protein
MKCVAEGMGLSLRLLSGGTGVVLGGYWGGVPRERAGFVPDTMTVFAIGRESSLTW